MGFFSSRKLTLDCPNLKLVSIADLTQFEKIEVNGPNTHPVFEFLKRNKKGFLGSENIKWNFTKFLVNKEGEVVGRFGSLTKPEKLEAQIQSIL